MINKLSQLDRLNLHLSNPEVHAGLGLDDLQALRDQHEKLLFFVHEIVNREGDDEIPSIVVDAAKEALTK